KEEKELNFVRHHSIKGVTKDAEIFQFNTSIAKLMELLNALYKYDADVENKNIALFQDAVADLLRLLSPFAPHFTEEMWQSIGKKDSVFNEKWPVWDEKAMVKDVVEIAIQVNGKVKGRMEIPTSAEQTEIEQLVMENGEIKEMLEGKQIAKIIVIKNRLVNIVVK
ncbi:MAG: leucyl-tRNA synthetase, partial [Clostridia bacterium]|nr:leucyl-tRNA synthetase [Clostridia bacterium]